jgi:hypothetical protein
MAKTILCAVCETMFDEDDKHCMFYCSLKCCREANKRRIASGEISKAELRSNRCVAVLDTFCPYKAKKQEE